MTAPLAADLRAWMFDVALPFWGAEGIDPVGGYVEHFSLDGMPFTARKRVRVICRQIYVFSHAAELGWPEGERCSTHGLRFLLDHAWLGQEGGWARTLDREGAVLDGTPDLYDLAFVLFALGWRHRVFGGTEARLWAHRTLDFIEAHMRHPSGVGLLHEKPAKGPRQQNPHMHLLEAALVWTEAGDARFRKLADLLVDLFATHFYDPATRTLAEFFDDDLRRVAGPQGVVTEPGHQMEWAWILANHQRLTGRDSCALVRGLTDFAEARGGRRRFPCHLQRRPGGRRTPGSRFAQLAEHRKDEGGGRLARPRRRRSASHTRAERPASPHPLPGAGTGRHMDRRLRR